MIFSPDSAVSGLKVACGAYAFWVSAKLLTNGLSVKEWFIHVPLATSAALWSVWR